MTVDTAESYEAFLERKTEEHRPSGLDRLPELHPSLFGYQRAVTGFLLRAGRGAAFLDTGLGKTFVQLEWARAVTEATGRPALILTPLAVGPQTAAEARRFGIDARVARDGDQVCPGINIANYERLHLFDPAAFGAVVLDESSILKSFTGKTTRRLIEAFASTPFRLACTATPAPNDHTELGQHSEFLGVMAANEMLIRWFVHDSANTKEWRLKRHGVGLFWDWVASWARCLSRPSDLGFSDEGFDLPALELRKHQVAVDLIDGRGDCLFRLPDTSATAIHAEKRRTLAARAERIAELVLSEPAEPWVVWCDTDYEADALTARIAGAVEVRGGHPVDVKERRLLAFGNGSVRVLITKPTIAGFGLNWQHCARMAFVGLSFSYERFYQAVRRCWRYGQRRPVQVHVIVAETEGAIWDAVARKSQDHDTMKAQMAAAMLRASRSARVKAPYEASKPMELPTWLKA